MKYIELTLFTDEGKHIIAHTTQHLFSLEILEVAPTHFAVRHLATQPCSRIFLRLRIFPISFFESRIRESTFKKLVVSSSFTIASV